ncbi:MAG: ABC transporter substrate-binding protein [Candidatus Lambdaproteobacteria bacterium]|nr:ABC transporter substrate-binding protein [Candidatus Lambdaproteobacteria bacterium]
MQRVLMVVMVLGIGLCATTDVQAQKYGGVLHNTLRNSPPDLSIHETAVLDTVSAMAPVYSNLVVFDVFQRLETLETIVPELAESWRWSADGRELTFRLRQDVIWHDGRPLTGGDVKHTFDVVRGATRGGLKLNPRKGWYYNIREIVTGGDREVTFKLGRPQPSILAMLAGGYSPVYPAHVSPVELRKTAVGTGPFRLKQYVPERQVELVKNPAYHVQGRPYLDGAIFHIIRDPKAQEAALLARQVDTGNINTAIKPVYERLSAADPRLKFVEMVSNATVNIIVNTKKPPFNDLRLRQAVNLAMERSALIRSVYQGGAVPGGALIPAPHGHWGLLPDQLQTLPGYGDPASDKSEARRLLAQAGYGPSRPLQIKISTRNEALHVGAATWAIGQLKEVGVRAELEHVDTAVWYGKIARREFQLGINSTAIGVDDPDAVLYETYACGSSRNYSDYCNPGLEKRFDAQSLETDTGRRLQMVREIDMTLQREVARPYLIYRKGYYPHQPYVKNWLPHTSIYNGWRLQEVWLDK